jgi:hypothetical protein
VSCLLKIRKLKRIIHWANYRKMHFSKNYRIIRNCWTTVWFYRENMMCIQKRGFELHVMALKEKVKKSIKIYYFSFSSLLTIIPLCLSTKLCAYNFNSSIDSFAASHNIYILGNVIIDLAGIVSRRV